MDNNNEKYHFQSETKQLLNLMIHSLYSNKEIFLRELISNASDAIDKLKFKLLSGELNNIQYQDMKIRITVNKEKKTIIISDNGIGMTKEEIIQNLGTIANSGTKKFIESLSNTENKRNDLIGKFGVGFYSAFMVSDKVVVKTRHFQETNPKNSLQWISDGKGEYFINQIFQQEYGTHIELYIKEKEKEFLEDWKINQIINKYSDHISVPIELQQYDDKTKIISWKQINQSKPLWRINPTEISHEEYEKFYENLTNDFNKPIMWTHNRVEGTQEYIYLLYIPGKSTWNILDYNNKNHGLKLYVKNVYIMDDANYFLPNYLRFIKGIIDSNNLPLNISREVLQKDYNTEILKSSLTKKVLRLIQKLQSDKEKYQMFWKEFGIILKEGIAEDIKNKDLISNLLRFTSINNHSPEQNLSLNNYIEKMKDKQEKIYFIISENYHTAINSPHLEIFIKNNIDVLILTDRIDDWVINYLIEFKGKKFQSINQIDTKLESILHQNNNIELTEEIKIFLENIKRILKNKVEKVTISNRLINSPVVLITDKNSPSIQMSRLLQVSGQSVPKIKYTLEINPHHALIKKIIKIKNEEQINTWVHILFDEALLSEQGSLEDPNIFIQRINTLLLSN